MAHDHDIFLSHSYADTDNAKQIVKAWKKFGYAVYADFLDDKLLEASKKKEMTAELSEHLRSKIKTSRVFVFLASSHAAGSGWMPWELGLAHGAVGRVHPCYLARMFHKPAQPTMPDAARGDFGCVESRC